MFCGLEDLGFFVQAAICFLCHTRQGTQANATLIRWVRCRTRVEPRSSIPAPLLLATIPIEGCNGPKMLTTVPGSSHDGSDDDGDDDGNKLENKIHTSG